MKFSLILSLLVLVSATAIQAADDATPAKQRVYLGTYTGAKSKGIYLSEFDADSGKLSEPKLVAETVNPTFLALHPDGKHLYAVNEVGEFLGKKAGGITAFSIDEKGGLTQLNQQHSGGPGPCHLVVDRQGKCVLAANYGGGSCCAVVLKDDGSLGEVTSFIQHENNPVPGPNGKVRVPRGHSINVSPDNKLALCADLGLDKVVIYSLDAATGKLSPHEPGFGKTPDRAGPRHFAFHPSGKTAYAINETGSSMTVFDFDAAKGSLTEVQTLSTLPEGFTANNSTAEVVVHPSGKFVYGSNRGHNSIAVFKVDEATGKLTAAGHQGEGIKTPRNFNIDLTGKWLLVGNQSGNDVLVFKIDQQTGALTPTANRIELAAPVCIKFLKQ
ncbi:6-phosphogluconolactonase [Anatilimnocola aggregata]|uniref:6-phosphogluconolactonase n=1 Tax=Anatilimnocola aggregata TaxID=2528021 RepID=A0A517YL20_9BACT|nr:lactonase family protein [Anatilimnocola aggregata]QDU30922.1 6-phosphogluconolactonase [Anatilimnocola aggregata]